MTGFGGALKNLGMGCGSRAGKMEMHSAGKPVVEQDKCIGCGQCIKIVLITGQVLLITKPLSIMINVLDAVAVLESVLKMQSLPAWMKLMTF